MRQLYWICFGLLLCALLGGSARAETFQLEDGKTLTGEVVSFNENGLIVRLADGTYSERVPWGNFSQDDLRRLAENPRITTHVEPFIEISQEELLQRTEVELKPVPRLERPASRSLLGALFSSGPGVLVLLALYAANLYAAHEIAVFRAQPVGLVCGVAAVAPLIGPIVFLAMPTRLPPRDSLSELTGVAAETSTFAMPSSPDADAAGQGGDPGGLRLTRAEQGSGTAGAQQPQIFQRGAFTFNRRFFETKFPGFFGMVRRDADKGMVLQIKTARGHFVGHRITRITAADLHIQVHGASEEVMVPFTEVQEVQLKHEDS